MIFFAVTVNIKINVGQLISLKKIKWCYNSFVPKGMKTAVKTWRQCCNYGFSCTPRLFSTDSRIAKK